MSFFFDARPRLFLLDSIAEYNYYFLYIHLSFGIKKKIQLGESKLVWHLIVLKTLYFHGTIFQIESFLDSPKKELSC